MIKFMSKLMPMLAVSAALSSLSFAADNHEQKEMTLEEATKQQATHQVCKRAYKIMLSKKPAGIQQSITNKHLQNNKQDYKSYFSSDSAEDVLETLLPGKNCTVDSTKYVAHTNVVECHLKCDDFIGYDVNLSNNETPTKNILLIYKAHRNDHKKSFLVELHPSENPNH
jgi:hypothetical protein